MCAKPMYKISRVLLPGYQFDKVDDVFLQPKEGWKLLIGRKGKKSVEATGYDKKLLVKNTRRNISQLHCELEFRNGQFFIYDFGSGNGTYYDGEQIKQSQRGGRIEYRRLVRGSTISLGVKDFEDGFVEDCFLFRYDEIVIKAERDRGHIAQEAAAGSIADNIAEKPVDDPVETEEAAEIPSEHAEMEASMIEQHQLQEGSDFDFHEQTTDPLIEELQDETGESDKEVGENLDNNQAQISRSAAMKATNKAASDTFEGEDSESKSDLSKCDQSGQAKKHKAKRTSRGQRLQQKRMQSAVLPSSDDDEESPAVKKSPKTKESKLTKETTTTLKSDSDHESDEDHEKPALSKKKQNKETERSDKSKKSKSSSKSKVSKTSKDADSSEAEESDEEPVKSKSSKAQKRKQSDNSDVDDIQEEVHRSKSQPKLGKSKTKTKDTKTKSDESESEECDVHVMSESKSQSKIAKSEKKNTKTESDESESEESDEPVKSKSSKVKHIKTKETPKSRKVNEKRQSDNSDADDGEEDEDVHRSKSKSKSKLAKSKDRSQKKRKNTDIESDESEESDEEPVKSKSSKQTKAKETPKSSKVPKRKQSDNSDVDDSEEEDRSKSKSKLAKSKRKSTKIESDESDAEERDEKRKPSKRKEPTGSKDKHHKTKSKGHERDEKKPHSSKKSRRDVSSESEKDVISPTKRKRVNQILSSSEDESDFIPKKKEKSTLTPSQKKTPTSDSKRSKKKKDDSDDEKREKKKKTRTSLSDDDFQGAVKTSSSKKRPKLTESEDSDFDDRKNQSKLNSTKSKSSKRRHSDSASDHARSRKKKRATSDRERRSRSRSSSSGSGSGVTGVIEEDIYVPKTAKPEAAVRFKPWELKKYVNEMLNREPVILVRKAFETTCEGTSLHVLWSEIMRTLLNDDNRDTIADQCVKYMEKRIRNGEEESVKESPRYTFFYEDGKIRTKKQRNYVTNNFSKKRVPIPRKQRKASESSSKTSSTMNRSDSESEDSTVPISNSGSRQKTRDAESIYSSDNSSSPPEQHTSFDCEPGPSKPPGPPISQPDRINIDSDSEDFNLLPSRAPPRQYDGAIARPSTNRTIKLIDPLPLGTPRKNAAAARIRRQDNLENEPELSQAEIRRQKLKDLAKRDKERVQQASAEKDNEVPVLSKAKVRVTNNTRQDRFLEDIQKSHH